MLVMESPSDSRKVGGTENLHLVSGLSTGSHFYSSLSLAANGQSANSALADGHNRAPRLLAAGRQETLRRQNNQAGRFTSTACVLKGNLTTTS